LTEQLNKGDDYSKLNKVISILIADFNITKGNNQFHSHYQLYEKTTGDSYPDSTEIHFVELHKLGQNDEVPLGKWARFFRAKTQEDFMKAAQSSPVIKEACDYLEYLIGPVNLPVTRLFIEEIILECRKNRVVNVNILGFEFKIGLFPNILEEAKSKGINVAPKYIPAEVSNKREVEKDQISFHDAAYIEIRPLFKNNEVAVEWS
jgi:hypothetical protein